MLIELTVQEVTLNGTELLVSVPAFTTTGPVVAPAGTVAIILVLVQEVVAATTPLTVTDPIAEPNFTPFMVTAIPVGPLVGERLVIPGVTVKFRELCLWPLQQGSLHGRDQSFPLIEL